jgi:FkbM family methyltransferase
MNQNELYDLQTIRVMQRILNPDSNCIDIGCHTGVFLDEIIKFSPVGSHFAFEPIPSLFLELSEKFSTNEKVTISNVAASDKSGEVSFQHVVSNPGYSGLKRRRYDRENEIVQEITVKSELLDNVVPLDVKIDLIKIDVEGAEFQVLRGASKILKRSNPVLIFEHGLGAADYYGTKPEDLFDFLVGECNYAIFIMEEWLSSNRAKHLDKAEFCDEFNSGRNFYYMSTHRSHISHPTA